MWQKPHQKRANPRHVRHAGRCKMRTPTVQRLLLGLPGRTRLQPLTAWPPTHQVVDGRHSDLRVIEEAYCLSPNEDRHSGAPCWLGYRLTRTCSAHRQRAKHALQ